MTPQERELVADLFDRLASLENAPRDPDAERMIADGLRRAPHALYALVQTVLVQDEALRRAAEQLRALQEPAEQPGFLDGIRDSLTGRTQDRRGSVPSVRQDPRGGAFGDDGARQDNRWNTGQVLGGIPQGGPGGYSPGGGYAQGGGFPPGGPQPEQPGGRGGSFLGTAAATAAGVIGGALLAQSLGSMLGGGQAHAGGASKFGDTERSPWGGSKDGDSSNSEIARDAGVGDVGRSGQSGGNDRMASLFDNQDGDGDDADYDDSDDFDGDFGSDTA